MAGRNLGGSNRYPHFRGTALIQYSTTQKRSDFRTLCYFILNGSFLSRVFTWRLRKSHHGPQIGTDDQSYGYYYRDYRLYLPSGKRFL